MGEEEPFELEAEFMEPVKTEEFRPVFTVTGDEWPEKEELLVGICNAVNGSLRG